MGAAPCLVGTVLVLPREEVLAAAAAQHRTRSRSLSWACGRGRSSNLYVACSPHEVKRGERAVRMPRGPLGGSPLHSYAPVAHEHAHPCRRAPVTPVLCAASLRQAGAALS